MQKNEKQEIFQNLILQRSRSKIRKMKIIEGKNAVLGRLASYVAKEALKGEEIIILNCNEVVITGNRENIKENFEAKRKRVGSAQKGPKHSRNSERIVKRVIRGMLDRKGRGRAAYKKIKCYAETPAEFQNAKKIIVEKRKKSLNKFIQVKELSK